MTPLALNPCPEAVTPEIVTFAFPLLVRVTLKLLLLPILTLPNAKLVGFAPNSCVADTPVPLSGITSGEPGVSLVKDTDPVTLPTELGSKPTPKVLLLPGAMVRGVVKPVVLNPAPETLAEETVRFVVPVFLSEIACELLLSVTTFPKLTLDGAAEISAWMPVPVRDTVRGEPMALLLIETLPVALPAEAGANCALSVVLNPELTVIGRANPLMLKPLPEALTAVIVKAAFPEFVRMMFCVELLPTWTLPKLQLAGLSVSCG